MFGSKRYKRSLDYFDECIYKIRESISITNSLNSYNYFEELNKNTKDHKSSASDSKNERIPTTAEKNDKILESSKLYSSSHRDSSQLELI